MGAVLPKPFLLLSGTPLLVHTLRTVARSPLIRKIILVIAAERESLCREILQTFGLLSVPIMLVHGGAERQDSVRCGLAALDPESEIVAIHDAARPFLIRPSLRRVFEPQLSMEERSLLSLHETRSSVLLKMG